MNTQHIEPATEAQLSYVKNLLAHRDPADLTVQMAQYMLDNGKLNKVLASAAIDDLKKLPYFNAPAVDKFSAVVNVVDPAPTAASKPVSFTTLQVGIYDSMLTADEGKFINGRYYIVYTTKYGTLAVKRLYKSYDTKSGYSWRKAPSYNLKTMVANGTAARLEKGTITSLGKKFNMCMCCGALLTDPQSVADGIGPICAAKYGYAH